MKYGISHSFGNPTDGAIHCTVSFQCRKLGYAIGLFGKALQKFVKVVLGIYQSFIDNDLSLVEINPLVLTKDEDVIALDAKINADDNGLFRHPKIAELRDYNEEDWREVEAGKHELNYIGLDGQIGCLVNGAGLAMATMDIIKYYGATPANFMSMRRSTWGSLYRM